MLESNKRKSLGRGLGALLGNDEAVDHIAGDKILSLDLLSPSKYQPRSDFDEDALKSLAQSIKEKGVLQPLLVRETFDGTYEIIAGERRFRASKMAGLTEVPVIVKEMNDKEVLEVALVENLLRENLSAIEEAEGLQRLIGEFSHTQEALSQIIGKSRSYVANTLRLLSLPADVHKMIKDNTLTAGHVRPFIGMENAMELAQKVASKGLNVRQAEALASQTKEPKRAKIIDTDIKEIERNLSKKLGLSLRITPNTQGGGNVILKYADIAELDKIIDFFHQTNRLNTTKKFTMDVMD